MAKLNGIYLNKKYSKFKLHGGKANKILFFNAKEI